MTKRFTIPFLICIILLVVSEYFLLQEVYSNKRLPVLVICSFGLIASIAFFWILFRQYRKALK